MSRWQQYSRLFNYLRPYPWQVVGAYGGMFIGTGLNLLVPQILQNAIDNGLAQRNALILLQAGALILALSFVRGALGFVQRYYGEWLSYRVAYDLRNQFYDRVQRLPFRFHDRAQTGDLMSRATSDITEAERFVGIGIQDLLAVAILLIGITIAMLIENAELALIALGPVVVLVLAANRFGNVVRPMFTAIQEQMGLLSSIMQESMTGIRVVQAFARQAYELSKFDEANDEWFARRYTVIKVWSNNWPFFTLLMAISVFLLLWFGGPRVLNGEITVGQLFAMISYIFMLSGPTQRLGFSVNLAATAAASGQRVFEILDQPDDEADAPNARVLDDVQGAVAFEQVSFRYGDSEPILTDISFSAQPGEVIALMGLTGAGKSTLINLIPRFYHATSGTVCVDGHDVTTLNAASLRRHIGIVLQDPFLFSSTIGENIAYGRPDAPAEEIVAAARAARAHDFITSFPEGYQTKVGERGVTLSGGQKQRIAIARALLMNPRILIMDDSTSSVDTETEHLIQQALQTVQKGRTTFIIAQRLLSLKNADQILVLDGGRIVQRGTHRDLVAQRGLYRDIYEVQLRDQETVAESEVVTRH